MKRKSIALLLALLLVLPMCANAGGNYAYYARHGDREVNQVAITIDDWWEPALIPEFMAVAEKYGVKFTCYPSGCNIKVEDGELWRSLLDAGHEIGSHGYQHASMKTFNAERFKKEYTKFEKALDEALGYHYEFLTVRLPYGQSEGTTGGGKTGRALHAAGFDHAVFWDYDKVNSVENAVKKIQNGSIVLIHANRHDLKYLEQLLEALSDKGFEYVTISQMFHITTRLVADEPEDNPYWNK